MHRPMAVILCALLFAQPALGQQKAKPKPALRGTIVASQPVPKRSPAPPPPALDALGGRSLFLPSPVAGAPVGGAPQQCRLACAQTYYFCLASDFPDQCPTSWGQCRAGCDAPTLTTRY